MKLRTRVLTGVLAVTLLVLAAFDVAAISVLHRYLIGRTDSNLQSALTMSVTRAEVMLAAPPVATVLHPVPAAVGAYDIVYMPAGRQRRPVVVQYAVNPVPVAYLARQPRLFMAQRGVVAVVTVNTSYRVAETKFAGGTLLASTSLRDVNAIVSRFRLIAIGGSAIAGLLIFAGVVLAMRRGLRPIETMADQADRITAGDLTHRVECARVPTEVGRLGIALNDMLARVEAHIAEREASRELMGRFFADASHELRNPLASLRANAELYQQGALREREQVDEAMRRIAIEAQRMSVLVDDMLRLARLGQHPARGRDMVDLPALIAGCVDEIRAADPGRAWHVSVDGELTAEGDEELLRRAVANLLANVRTHTPEGTTARVTAQAADGMITIEVSDDGPGVPAEQLPRIFERFYRANAPAGRPGSGLGLAIVAEVAAAHGGTATAEPSAAGGLTVTIRVPGTDVKMCRPSSTFSHRSGGG